MIGFLRGSVLYKTENTIIIENAGIGYEVHVSEDTFLCLHEDDTVQLYIYHHITENGQSLYGFKSMNERRFFMLLISVSGIGPKSALSIMQVPIDTTLKALSQGNMIALTELPGVGRKTAERMVLELKNKVSGIHLIASKKFIPKISKLSNTNYTPSMTILKEEKDIQKLSHIFEGKLSLKDLEKAYIIRVLKNNRGNRCSTAEVLGIHRNTLMRKCQEYNINI